MQAMHSALGEQAFGEDARSLTTIAYQSHQDALKFLESSLRDPDGVALLYGPAGAGKSTISRILAKKLSRYAAVAQLDGTRMKPHDFLARMLEQFGHDIHDELDDEMLKMVNEYAGQQTRTYQPPVLIIDNVDRMFPSTLRILNMLAALTVPGLYILRIVLTGHETLAPLVQSEGLSNLAERNPRMFSLAPLTAKETMLYLHARLKAAGRQQADTVFPFDVCDRLRDQSGGWPGLLNHFALEALKRATDLPVTVADTLPPDETAAAPAVAPAAAPAEQSQKAAQIPVLTSDTARNRLPPRLIITRDGNVVTEYTFKEKKVLIGRSDFADIVIEDDFVSKLHLALLLYADALVLLDLNSANGTTVNSIKVGKTILKSDDIISLGRHRLKVENAPLISEEMAQLLKSPDTLKMKNLVDMRRLRARRRAKAAERRNRGA
jgi:type II secretory pathway predicted ATPase ExeA/pSer/pThr/pTyr-binding forkhead associated (FHA) protein